MSKITSIVLGIMLFCVFFTIMFEIAGKFNAGYNTTVDSRYAEQTTFYSDIGDESTSLAMNISQSSPGGPVLASRTENTISLDLFVAS